MTTSVGLPALPRWLLSKPISRQPTRLPDATRAAIEVMAMPRAVNQGRPLASIIVPSRDNLVFLKLCLASVLANTDVPFEIIAVDNGSSDGTSEFLRELEQSHRCVRTLRNDDNFGFARAINQGLTAAVGDVLVLLNDDTVVPPGWLGPLCQHAASPGIGLVGPVTNRIGNEAQVDADYDTYEDFLRFAEQRASRHNTLFDIPMLTMFCLAMTRGVFDNIGPLDERFALGFFEDDDYSLRVRARGYRIVCLEGVFIHHFGETSFGKLAATGEA